MPELEFKVEKAAAVPYSVSPLIGFDLRITTSQQEQQIQSIALGCQIQLDVTQRRYAAPEQGRLYELFGEPERWKQTLRTMLWTHVNTVVPTFTGSTVVKLPVPCTFDFNVAATKYFAGLESGEIPLVLLFSGTVFYYAGGDSLQITQIPWEKEAKYRLPVSVWQEMMEIYYPNSAWLVLRREIFDRLYQYKMHHAIPTWEEALEGLLDSASKESTELLLVSKGVES